MVRRLSDVNSKKIQRVEVLDVKTNTKPVTLTPPKGKDMSLRQSYKSKRSLRASEDLKRIMQGDATWDCLSPALSTLGKVCMLLLLNAPNGLGFVNLNILSIFIF